MKLYHILLLSCLLTAQLHPSAPGPNDRAAAAASNENDDEVGPVPATDSEDDEIEGDDRRERIHARSGNVINKYLKEHPERINAFLRRSGKTLFMAAVQKNSTMKEIDRIFSYKPCLKTTDRRGNDALYYALCNEYNCSPDVMQKLIISGIDHLKPYTVEKIDYTLALMSSASDGYKQATLLEFAQEKLEKEIKEHQKETDRDESYRQERLRKIESGSLRGACLKSAVWFESKAEEMKALSEEMHRNHVASWNAKIKLLKAASQKKSITTVALTAAKAGLKGKPA